MPPAEWAAFHAGNEQSSDSLPIIRDTLKSELDGLGWDLEGVKEGNFELGRLGVGMLVAVLCWPLHEQLCGLWIFQVSTEPDGFSDTNMWGAGDHRGMHQSHPTLNCPVCARLCLVSIGEGES